MSNKKGFTLIELLAVVLILGILSSIALPMYQKAVEKSRAAEAFTILDAMSKATYSYMMTEPHGLPPSKFAELTVTLPRDWTGNTKWYNDNSITDTLSNKDWSIQLATDSDSIANIWIGRISGSYAGAGFVRQVTTEGEGDTYCAEHISGGGDEVIFQLQLGDYCYKLWDVPMHQDSNANMIRGEAPIL